MCAGVLLHEFYFKCPQVMLNCVFYICEVGIGLNSFILHIYVGRLPFQEYWFDLYVGKPLVLHRLWFNPVHFMWDLSS